MLPCISIASVRPSGETATDIEVPSLTVTGIGATVLRTVCATAVLIAHTTAAKIRFLVFGWNALIEILL
jgi:hypothetical protein